MSIIPATQLNPIMNAAPLPPSTHDTRMTASEGQAMYLRNSWYVAARDREVGLKPLARTLLERI